MTPKLDPGNYQFEVRAADDNRNVDPTPAAHAFSVLLPFWRKPAFVAPITILGLLSLIALATMRQARSRRRKAERQQAKSEERYRILVETMNDGLGAIDKGGHFSYVNPKLAEMLGYKAEEMVGRPADAFFDEKNQAVLKEQLAKRKEGVQDAYEIVWTKKDGGKLLTVLSPVPIFDDKGDFDGSFAVISDITERKRAEEKLRVSEEKFSKAFHSTHDFITITSLSDGILVEINEAVEHGLKYKREELLGKKISALDVYVNLEDRAEFADILRRVGHVRDFEVQLRTKEGDILNCILNAEVIELFGEPHIVSITHDITERKRAEEALRESEERFRILFENAPLGYQSLNEQGDFIELNETWCKVLGYTKEEVLGRNFSEFIHPDFREVFNENFPKFKSIGYILGVEFEMIKKDGSEITVSFDGKIGHEEDGSFRQTHCVLKDITDRKRAEEELRTSLERFQTVMDSLDALVYVADFDTYEVLFINKYGRDVWGDIAGEICWKSLQSDQTGPCEFCTKERLVDSEDRPTGVHRYEFQNTVNGRWFDCRDQAAHWLDGRLVRMEIATEITERKRTEEEREKLEAQLRQSQKMEAIGTLAGGIAHDFNNILQAICSFTELAMYDVPSDSKTYEFLQHIAEGGERATELVRHILTFSRQREQTLQSMRIQIVLKEALNLLRGSLPATIKIRANIQKDCEAILADPTQIHQVIMNLCTNAYHAMRDEGGVLEVRLKETELSRERSTEYLDIEPGNFVSLVVRDTGCGMDEETKERIFEPFFTTKEAGEGTGMGLSTVHGIVMSHGGAIAVESKPGQGATFEVLFPVHRVPGDATEKESMKLDLPTGNENVLFVDDEEVVVEQGAIALERLGYNVTAHTNSIEALEPDPQLPSRFESATP